jgi:putative spermidine/putrescine transport system permease protein
VRVYAWRLILDPRRRAQLVALASSGCRRANIGYSNWAIWIVFSYIWLPFMILPIYAALERIPDSYIEASRDLGARGWRPSARSSCRSRCRGSSPARSSRSR